ncbi:Hypothetical cytosolic protein [Collimonas fungivorans Ter331]|uniref:Hypothetical cytosolic protein n=1 Tax=Collimonas fungivorans (strain Ter331) TaxID=1005048 RepID=G0AJI9_COLFT|nr:Hypothetical cytosolic protein [Collimonas fungivorans Ter331]
MLKCWAASGPHTAIRSCTTWPLNLPQLMGVAGAKNSCGIVSALRRDLSWTHIKALIYIDDELKRSFYIELCRLEHWSSRQLQERMNAMLFERSTLSKQPDKIIAREVAQPRQTGQVLPAFLLKDPYLVDFLGLQDRYLEKDLESLEKHA